MEQNFVSVEVLEKMDFDKNDPEMVEVVEKARSAFNDAVKVFPDVKADAFLSAFLAGYFAGITKASDEMKEMVRKWK